jgi:hypothetical protein
MNLSPALRDCLQFLFNSYRNNSNEFYDIRSLATQHGSDPLALAAQLKTLGLIRDEVKIDGDEIKCSISVDGINKTDASYIGNRINEVVKGLGEANSIANVPDLLKFDGNHFQEAFDIANEMQNQDLVKLLYAFQPKNTVNVEVTLEGVKKRFLI